MKKSEATGSTLELFPHLLDSPDKLSRDIDPFTITTTSGFLPFELPPVALPDAFKSLDSLTSRLPVVKADGSPGLLATFELGPAVLAELPDLTDEVDKLLTEDGKPDRFMITAVFRDYTFVCSSYLLEPCYERWSKDPAGGYGVGRETLPKCIARPLYRCAEMLIRAFERGLDPKSSEAGFILTHVDMVKESAALVSGAVRILNKLEESKEPSSREEVNDAFREILKGMEKVETCMEDMWKNSKPSDYLSFRVFIFGITSQSMFPNGVVYEGVLDNKPLNFRGESGANDSIIPLLDHLLQIPMPSTPLTKILHEFRAYRPLPHRQFLAHVASKAEEIGVQEFAVQDAETVLLYLKALDHVRSFRWRHWLLTREYIIKRTPYPTATGGSPIITWLPNQLFAVLELMISIHDKYVAPFTSKDLPTVVDTNGSQNGASSSEQKKAQKMEAFYYYRAQTDEMMALVRDQKDKLDREVARWCQERGL
ncbi:conserved hypothetical protein [Histoplasma mississippiense (nom. inval.)]|uniref:conserved hypothetical protein n=1 Tax=Ajellomyces capsulatus (strain NAm1 / WU24) TaxID=2059318 RepID=UPI000157C363|nr:conserved hypothetical protein [Histoplasma mississippiense (nom. inval.)]EDN07922.1 conserved hypothetical protein [Histoplasma mississippiense (nom. inval.)]